jgi:hypothetical protein
MPEELDDFKSETPQAWFRYQDGILTIELKPELIIDLRTAQRIEKFRKKMTRGQSIPVLLLIPENHLLLDKDAFNYFGSEEAMTDCLAKAVVLKAPLRVLLRNFSLTFYRQPQPFRLFISRSEAKIWLFDQLGIELGAEV